MKKTTTTKEYNAEGVLIKEVIIQEEFNDETQREYIPYIPQPIQPYQPWDTGNPPWYPQPTITYYVTTNTSGAPSDEIELIPKF